MKSQTARDSLADVLSEGLVVDRVWLSERGFNRPLVDYYLRSGALVPVARGAYRRPGPPLKWEHVVYSLQELGYSVHVGGRSSLELQGFAHYLSMTGIKQVHLYGADKLPGWVGKMATPYQLTMHKARLFDELVPESLMTKPFGHWDWLIPYATPELALIEMAAEVKQPSDFDVLDKLFESATSLRPKLLMKLLEACHHIKAKRLFLWFSQRHNFAWFKQIDIETVNLGSGKRLIVKGGAFDNNYQITVPKQMTKGTLDGFEQSFL